MVSSIYQKLAHPSDIIVDNSISSFNVETIPGAHKTPRIMPCPSLFPKNGFGVFSTVLLLSFFLTQSVHAVEVDDVVVVTRNEDYEGRLAIVDQGFRHDGRIHLLPSVIEPEPLTWVERGAAGPRSTRTSPVERGRSKEHSNVAGPRSTRRWNVDQGALERISLSDPSHHSTKLEPTRGYKVVAKELTSDLCGPGLAKFLATIYEGGYEVVGFRRERSGADKWYGVATVEQLYREIESDEGEITGVVRGGAKGSRRNEDQKLHLLLRRVELLARPRHFSLLQEVPAVRAPVLESGRVGGRGPGAAPTAGGTNERQTGTVRFFNPKNKTGFITPDSGGEDVYFCPHLLQDGSGRRRFSPPLNVGETCSFSWDERMGQAINVVGHREVV